MFDNQRDESDEDDDDDDDQETDSDCGGVVVGLLPPQRKVGQSQIWQYYGMAHSLEHD